MAREAYPLPGVFTGLDDNGFPTSDRDYNDADYARFMSDFRQNGVINKGINPLFVTAAGGMNVRINFGVIHINGRRMEIYGDDPEFLTLDTGDSQPRIDLIAIRLDLRSEVRDIVPAIIKGVPSAVPVMPALTRDDLIYDMVLAKIEVPDGAYSIIQDDITDTRGDDYLCGMQNWSIEQRGQPNGVAPLGPNGKIPLEFIPDNIVTGTYTGNAAADRTISLGFTPSWVQVARRGLFGALEGGGFFANIAATSITEYNASTNDAGITAWVAQSILGCVTNGFRISATVNTGATIYFYRAGR